MIINYATKVCDMPQYQITLIMSGRREIGFDCPDDKIILDRAEEVGLGVLHSITLEQYRNFKP